MSAPAPLNMADDDSGESDFDYFRRYPGATARLRLPWPTEFPADFMEQRGGVAFVRITVIKRDVATGRPTRVARSLRFCSGGSA
jgi:hypothetical protein